MNKIKKINEKSFSLTRLVNKIERTDTLPTPHRAKSSGDNVLLYNNNGVLVIDGHFSEWVVDEAPFENSLDCAKAINDVVNFNGGGANPPTPEEWTRPKDRPAPPTFKDGEQSIYWLFGVAEHNENDYAFRLTESSGNYIVDWGDGTVDTVANNVTAEHVYDFSSINIPVSSEGYKWIWIKAAPTNGNFTEINISQYRPIGRANASTNNIYIPQVFEIYLQASEVVGIPFSNTYYTLNKNLNIFNYKGSNKIANFAYFLYNCISLYILNISTFNGKVFSYFLQSCYSFNQTLNIDTSNGLEFVGFMSDCRSFNHPLNINTSNGSNFSAFMSGCCSFNHPLNIDTSKGVTFANFFSSCYSFNQPLNIDTSKGRALDAFMYFCYSFNQPLNIDTSNCRNLSQFMFNCQSFNQLFRVNTSESTSFNNFMYGCQSFNYPLEIDASKGTVFVNFLAQCFSLPHLRLSSFPIFQTSLSLANTSLNENAVMNLLQDLPDRTATTTGTLTLTGTPAVKQLTTEQIAEFTNKNWTLVL